MLGLCAWGRLLEDEEVEWDCLGSEVTMFDRQQRTGEVVGLVLLEVVGEGT